MKNKKKLTAVAVTTALSVTAFINPLIIHAQEGRNISTQDIAVEDRLSMDKDARSKLIANNKTILTMEERTNSNAFTNADVAELAIINTIATYELTNETSQQEINNLLIKNFIDTGKLKEISLTEYSKSDATESNIGILQTKFQFMLYDNSSTNTKLYRFSIPRLPKDGELAVNSKNFPDPVFREYIKTTFSNGGDPLTETQIANIKEISIKDEPTLISLEGIENFTNLEKLTCIRTGIQTLNLSQNKELKELQCHGNNDLSTLDISGCLNLEILRCYTSAIQTLNISNNKELTELDCSNTNLTSLDVSPCEKLTSLLCFNTSITSLDLSNTLQLRELNCYYTPLAYLNIGHLNSLNDMANLDVPPSSNLPFQVTGNQFNIKDNFPEIDITKISKVTNASYQDGIFSNYSLDKSISYEYNCGKSKTMSVTLNLEKGKTTITINKDLNKTYDGKAVSLDTKDIIVEGSSKIPQLTWWEEVNGTWQTITSAPVNVGNYGVSVHVGEDEFCEEGNLEAVEFKITPKDVVDKTENEEQPEIKENEVEEKPTVVKTGDENVIGLWSLIAIISMGMIRFIKRKKYHRE